MPRSHNHEHLQRILGFYFIIRFKKCYRIEAEGYTGKAENANPRNGRILMFRDARLTGDKRDPHTLVLVKARKMKDAWCLATSISTFDGKDIVAAYSRRCECEEGFRDRKDWPFALPHKSKKISDNLRRERLLFPFALSALLLTLAGFVSERFGLDRPLRANTSKTRTHALFRQGREIARGASPGTLEHRCMKEVFLRLTAAPSESLCHAFS